MKMKSESKVAQLRPTLRDLMEAEDIKKSWQEYTEELYKKMQ